MSRAGSIPSSDLWYYLSDALKTYHSRYPDLCLDSDGYYEIVAVVIDALYERKNGQDYAIPGSVTRVLTEIEIPSYN